MVPAGCLASGLDHCGRPAPRSASEGLGLTQRRPRCNRAHESSERGGAVGGSDPSDEVAKLGGLLAQPDLRKAFWLDPEGTLTQQNIDVGLIPNGLLDTLKALTPMELSILSRISTTLLERLSDNELPLMLRIPF
jgi:hypothetical protein